MHWLFQCTQIFRSNRADRLWLSLTTVTANTLIHFAAVDTILACNNLSNGIKMMVRCSHPFSKQIVRMEANPHRQRWCLCYGAISRELKAWMGAGNDLFERDDVYRRSTSIAVSQIIIHCGPIAVHVIHLIQVDCAVLMDCFTGISVIITGWSFFPSSRLCWHNVWPKIRLPLHGDTNTLVHYICILLESGWWKVVIFPV